MHLLCGHANLALFVNTIQWDDYTTRKPHVVRCDMSPNPAVRFDGPDTSANPHNVPKENQNTPCHDKHEIEQILRLLFGTVLYLGVLRSVTTVKPIHLPPARSIVQHSSCLLVSRWPRLHVLCFHATSGPGGRVKEFCWHPTA